MSDLLRIERMVYGGGGVGVPVAAKAGTGSSQERVVVPFVLPGELVSIGPGKMMEVLEASAERVVPGCRHFGVCGGCQYQHAAYGTQMAVKKELLLGQLQYAGLTELPPLDMHEGEPWGYRNRIRLRAELVEGSLRLGYNARVYEGSRGAPEFMPMRECPIAAGVLVRAAAAFASGADAVLQAGGEWIGAVREVELFTTADESRLQLTVYLREDTRQSGRRSVSKQKEFAALCDGLNGVLPELMGAGLMVLPAVRPGAGSRQAQRARAMAAWGLPGLQYTVSEGARERRYWVSRGGFFQGNRFLLGELIRLATAGRRGKLAWDLYAGVGLFSQVLADFFEQVTAVESGEVAAADLASGAKRAGVLAVRTTTAEFLRGALLERDRPELVVMDPPRAGVGFEVVELLGRVGAGEVVYVSCDPTTLARDLRAMVDSGYNLAELHLVDLFPQTFHMETVAVLRR